MLTTLVNSCSCDASLETGRDNLVRSFEDALRQISWSEIDRARRDATTISELAPDLYCLLNTQRREYAKNMKQQRNKELFNDVLAVVKSDSAHEKRFGTWSLYDIRQIAITSEVQTISQLGDLWDALKAARRAVGPAVGQIEETPR